MIARRSLLVVAVSLLMALEVAAEVRQTVVIDYRKDEAEYTLVVQDEEVFIVRIENACKGEFEVYKVTGRPRKARSGTPDVTPTPTEELDASNSVMNLRITHDDSFAGYFVDVSTKEGEQPCKVAGDALEPKRLQIYTPEPESWNVSFSAGLTMNGLINPVYAIQPHPTMSDSKQVVERNDRRDVGNLDVAAFVTTYHEDYYPGWGLSCGLGLGLQGTTAKKYYFGLAKRFNRTTTIIFGGVFGPVKRLPAAVSLDEPVDVSKIDLTSLPTKTEMSWFFSFSYSIGSVGTTLRQMIAGWAGGS